MRLGLGLGLGLVQTLNTVTNMMHPTCSLHNRVYENIRELSDCVTVTASSPSFFPLWSCTERGSVGRAENGTRGSLVLNWRPREMMKLRLDVPRKFGTPVATPELKITSSWPWAWKRNWTDTDMCSQNSLTKKKKKIREQTGNLEPKNSWKFWLGHVQYKCTGR